jgi:hypothetical protein
MVISSDRLATDTHFCKGIGARTALVLSGAQKLADLEEMQTQGAMENSPDLLLQSLADLLPTSNRIKSEELRVLRLFYLFSSMPLIITSLWGRHFK